MLVVWGEVRRRGKGGGTMVEMQNELKKFKKDIEPEESCLF